MIFIVAQELCTNGSCDARVTRCCICREETLQQLTPYCVGLLWARHWAELARWDRVFPRAKSCGQIVDHHNIYYNPPNHHLCSRHLWASFAVDPTFWRKSDTASASSHSAERS